MADPTVSAPKELADLSEAMAQLGWAAAPEADQVSVTPHPEVLADAARSRLIAAVGELSKAIDRSGGPGEGGGARVPASFAALARGLEVARGVRGEEAVDGA